MAGRRGDHNKSSKQEDGGSRQNEKKKKKKNTNQDNRNPLAQARGQQKAPDNVWFRRSGTGFRLFVEYYAQQPKGVVYCGVTNASIHNSSDPLNDPDSSITKILLPHANINRKQQESALSSSLASSSHSSWTLKRKEDVKECHGGMSRAAKRRRRKRNGGNGDNETNDNQNDADHISSRQWQTQGASSSCLVMDKDESLLSPLWNAVKSYYRQNKNYSSAAQVNKQQQEALPFFYAMSRPLPTTLRIRQRLVNSVHLDELRDKLDALGPTIVSPSSLQPLNTASPSLSSSSSLPIIYQSPYPKSKLSLLAPSLKDLLVEYSQNGTLARQELGSMLPVMILTCGGHLQPGHCIVDMCASPGSKTLQALEQVVQMEGYGPMHRRSHPKKGLVLANDILESRVEALQAAVQRAGIPNIYTQRIRYSQVDATKLSLSCPCDAVLCDVPCSGDGTCRKDIHILPMWQPQAGNALHATQLAILQRSLELVKGGGVVCYSTCSLNPVEDEAVVAAVLKNFQDTVELIEITGLLQGWKHRRGVETWKVAVYDDEETRTAEEKNNDDDDEDNYNDNDEIPTLTWFNNYQEAKAAGRSDLLPTMFANDNVNDEESSTNHHTSSPSLHLNRCARLLPQDYDSGGFFLALLRKVQ